MSIDALFSSKKHNWRTPRWLFDQLDREFGFGLDAAASADNRLCGAYLGPDNSRPECRDALTGAPWRTFADAVFLNPPYGREVGAFLARAFEQSRQGCTVVCLVFARTETTWWQDYVMRAAQVRFIRGRLSFLDPDTGRPTGPATAPSAVVVFAPWSEGPPAFTTMERPAALREVRRRLAEGTG